MKAKKPKSMATRAPTFAVGLDGTVYVDLRGLGDVDNVEDAVKLIAAGERCFIGVAVRRAGRRRLRRYLEDAGVECAAFVLAERRPRK